MSTALDYRRLSIADRIRLVQDIWDSIADESTTLEVPPSHQVELDRRIDELARTPEDVQTWQATRCEVEAALEG